MDRSSTPTVKQTSLSVLLVQRTTYKCLCACVGGFQDSEKRNKKGKVVVQTEGGTGGVWAEERLGPSVRFLGRSYRCSEMSVHFFLRLFHPELL